MDKAKSYNKTSDPVVEPLLKLLNLKENEMVLEIGCGYGHLAKIIAEKVGVNGRVIATDPSAERISMAKEMYQDSLNLEFLQCSSIDFPVDRMYASCICNKTLHWIKTDEKRTTFQRIFSVLKPGGLFVGNISFHMPKNVSRMISLLPSEHQKDIENWHDRENKVFLKNMFLEAGFDILKFEDLYVEYPIGDEKKFLKFISTAFFEKFNFEDEYTKRGNEIKFLKDENNHFLHDFNGLIFSVKKPEP